MDDQMLCSFKKRFYLFLICLQISFGVSALPLHAGWKIFQANPSNQKRTINGFVRDKETGEPLSGVNVILKNTLLGAASDVHGYYVINGIPNGKYLLILSMIGYELVEKEIKVQLDAATRFDFEVAPKAIELEGVVVTGEKNQFQESVEVSRINIRSAEIRNTPAFIEADVFRTIQQLPSVTSQNDFSSALIVRGGSPDENLITIDGAEIYNPYHLGGLFSTFNADAISEADFKAGGYSAEHPGRLSSVLNIVSREGNSKQGKFFKNSELGKYWDLSGVKADISLLSSKALAEGPFYKGAWILSGRRTYFDLLADAGGQGEDWAYYFWDNQFKIFSDLNDQNRLTFSTFNGSDVLKFKFDEDDFNTNFDFNWNWGNNSASLQWRFIPNSNFLSELILARSGFNFDLDLIFTEIDSATGGQNELKFAVLNKINNLSATEKITWFASPNHTLTSGLSFKKPTMEFNFELNNTNFFNIKEKPGVLSAFVQDKWKLNSRFSVELGVRASKYELHKKLYLDPRLGFKYLLSDVLSLKGNWGKFNQFLFTTNDENEVLRIVDFWQPVPQGMKPLSNQHFILGLERWFGQGFTGSVESYYKPYSNVITNNPNNEPGIDNDEFISGTGSVWGVELLLRKNSGKLTGWLGYSLSHVERKFDFNSDGVIEKTGNEASEIYAPIHAKPHSLNLVVSYEANPKNRFSLSWSQSSGQPYTPVIGKVFHGGGQLNDPYSEIVNIQGEKNSARTPLYTRGDIAWVRSATLFDINVKFKLNIVNFLNKFNVLTYIWDHNKSPSEVRALSMFPILPTVGLEFEL